MYANISERKSRGTFAFIFFCVFSSIFLKIEVPSTNHIISFEQSGPGVGLITIWEQYFFLHANSCI